MATGSELPEDLQSIELLFHALLGDEEDEFDKILSQLPSPESLDPYFPQGACNSVQSTPSNNRFQDPVSEEEVKAAQKAVIPHNTQKNTNWAVSVWKEWSQSRWSRFSSVPFECPAHLYILASSSVQLDHWMSRFILEAR